MGTGHAQLLDVVRACGERSVAISTRRHDDSFRFANAESRLCPPVRVAGELDGNLPFDSLGFCQRRWQLQFPRCGTRQAGSCGEHTSTPMARTKCLLNSSYSRQNCPTIDHVSCGKSASECTIARRDRSSVTRDDSGRAAAPDAHSARACTMSLRCCIDAALKLDRRAQPCHCQLHVTGRSTPRTTVVEVGGPDDARCRDRQAAAALIGADCVIESPAAYGSTGSCRRRGVCRRTDEKTRLRHLAALSNRLKAGKEQSAALDQLT